MKCYNMENLLANIINFFVETTKKALLEDKNGILFRKSYGTFPKST
jgi:hypothetical protein